MNKVISVEIKPVFLGLGASCCCVCAFILKAELQDVRLYCVSADRWRRTEECCTSSVCVCEREA